MSQFTKVAVLGKGFLGSAVVGQLLKNGFTTTVLTRSREALKAVPPEVNVVEVDYSSVESLTTALRGQDAVVSTTGFGTTSLGKVAIEACIKAGVKRYVPSDWGSLTTDPAAQQVIPLLAGMGEIQRLLADKAASGALEYTVFSVGTFLDYILGSRAIVDFQNKKVTLYDDGKHPFSSTSLETIGKAVAAALKKPEATKNRNIFVHDALFTQEKLVALGQKYTPGVAWQVANLDAEAEEQRAVANIKNGINDMATSYALLLATTLGGKYNSAYQRVDNDLLGLPVLTDEEIEAKIAALYEGGEE